MREIKFRGKCALGGNWEYGFLTKKKNRRNGEINFAIAVDDCSLANTIPVHAETIGQFTGVYDIDGNEIYEGDILKDTDGEIFAVYYQGCCWLAGVPYVVESTGLFECNLEEKACQDCKVIGNIFDNPELLEAEKND